MIVCLLIPISNLSAVNLNVNYLFLVGEVSCFALPNLVILLKGRDSSAIESYDGIER